MLIKKRSCCNQDNIPKKDSASFSVNTGVAVRTSAHSECADVVVAKQTFANGPAEYMEVASTNICIHVSILMTLVLEVDVGLKISAVAL